MAKLKVLGGDFIEHPGSSYFMGEFTLWGWKPGEKKPACFRLTVRRDVIDVGLVNSGAMPVAAVGVSGAARGAVLGAALGPAGAVAGALLGGASSAASAKAFNHLARRGRQRFSVKFNDGRKLDAEMDVRVVAGLQNRLIRSARSSRRRQVGPQTGS